MHWFTTNALLVAHSRNRCHLHTRTLTIHQSLSGSPRHGLFTLSLHHRFMHHSIYLTAFIIIFYLFYFYLLSQPFGRLPVHLLSPRSHPLSQLLLNKTHLFSGSIFTTLLPKGLHITRQTKRTSHGRLSLQRALGEAEGEGHLRDGEHFYWGQGQQPARATAVDVFIKDKDRRA